MKILLDHCMPRSFRRLLTACDVKTTFEMRWADLGNGELLAAAAPLFNAFITVDQNIRYQQNLATLPLSVFILVAPNNQLAILAPYAPIVLETLQNLKSICLVRIFPDGSVVI